MVITIFTLFKYFTGTLLAYAVYRGLLNYGMLSKDVEREELSGAKWRPEIGPIQRRWVRIWINWWIATGVVMFVFVSIAMPCIFVAKMIEDSNSPSGMYPH